MSGIVMLWVLATAAITYGWVPDGSDGVRYIIQIPADDLEQLRQVGEISSQIDARMRGHVSEVVVRVGDGPVPRNTPDWLLRRATASGKTADSVAAADAIPMPIPSIQLNPLSRGDSIGPTTTAVLKPAPQSGGMNLPGGFQMPSTDPVANSQPNQTVPTPDLMRNRVNQMAGGAIDRLNNQFQQAGQTLQDTARRTSDAFADRARETLGLPDDPRLRLQTPTTNGATMTGGMPTTGTPSNDLRSSNIASRPDAFGNSVNRQDPDWYTLGERPSPPSTEPAISGRGSQLNNQFSNDAFGRQQELQVRNTNGTRSPLGSMPRGLQETNNSFASSGTNLSMNGSRSDGSLGNGRDVRGLDPRQLDPRMVNSIDYDPQLSATDASRLPRNGYSFDSQGYPIDREGYRLNRNGDRIGQQTPSLTYDPSRQGSTFGYASDDRREDLRSTQAAPRQWPTSTTSVGSNPGNELANRYPGNGSDPNWDFRNDRSLDNRAINDPRSRVANNDPRGMDVSHNGTVALPNSQSNASQFSNDAYQRNVATGGVPPQSQPMPNVVNQMPTTMGIQPVNAQFGGVGVNPSFPGGLANNGAMTEADRLRAAARQAEMSPTNSLPEEHVAAQPLFNVLLLMSIVGNVYLISWLKAKRLQFR
ncbi:MAG: hypothetical protein AAF539_02920, partial [Planctomycetota bacterium]